MKAGKDVKISINIYKKVFFEAAISNIRSFHRSATFWRISSQHFFNRMCIHRTEFQGFQLRHMHWMLYYFQFKSIIQWWLCVVWFACWIIAKVKKTETFVCKTITSTAFGKLNRPPKKTLSLLQNYYYVVCMCTFGGNVWKNLFDVPLCIMFWFEARSRNCLFTFEHMLLSFRCGERVGNLKNHWRHNMLSLSLASLLAGVSMARVTRLNVLLIVACGF